MASSHSTALGNPTSIVRPNHSRHARTLRRRRGPAWPACRGRWISMRRSGASPLAAAAPCSEQRRAGMPRQRGRSRRERSSSGCSAFSRQTGVPHGVQQELHTDSHGPVLEEVHRGSVNTDAVLCSLYHFFKLIYLLQKTRAGYRSVLANATRMLFPYPSSAEACHARNGHRALPRFPADHPPHGPPRSPALAPTRR